MKKHGLLDLSVPSGVRKFTASRLFSGLAVLFFMLAAALPVYADSVEFVYRNTVSSTDFQTLPDSGDVFRDEDGNILIVKKTETGTETGGNPGAAAVVFDKFYTKTNVRIGSQLSRRPFLKKVELYGGLAYSFADISFSSTIYPFELLVTGGYVYSEKAPFAAAGVRVTVPLAGIWDTTFTLLEDARLEGFIAAGAKFTSSESDFTVLYGITYRHNVGVFNWGIGANWLTSIYTARRFTPTLTIGAAF